MTAQINDRVFHRKIEFHILDKVGDGLFVPSMHGIEPVTTCTACVRGYHVRYAIEKGQLVLSRVTIGTLWTYDGLQEPVQFTGVLLLGAERIEHLFLHPVSFPAWKYEKVRQVRFDEGRLIEDLDRSREVEELRAQYTVDPELLMEALRRGS